MDRLPIIPMHAANAMPASRNPKRRDLADSRPPESPNNSHSAPKKNMIVAPIVLPLRLPEFMALMFCFGSCNSGHDRQDEKASQ